MPLHPQVKVVLDLMEKAGQPMHHLSPQQAREQTLAMRATKGDPEPVGKVEDRTIKDSTGDIPIRIYTPNGRGPFPVLVYFHGGGWVVGSVETVDASCRALTNLANCVTVSVDYRLAPEHKFPEPVDDCYTATRWTALNAASFHSGPGPHCCWWRKCGGKPCRRGGLDGARTRGAIARAPVVIISSDELRC